MTPPASERLEGEDDSVSLLVRASRGSETSTAIDLIDAALAHLSSSDPARIDLAAQRARVLLTLDSNDEAIESASALLSDATTLATRLRLTSTIALGTFALGEPPIELPPVDWWLGECPTAHLEIDARLALADYAVVQVANGDVIEGAQTARLARGGDDDDDVLGVIAGIASTMAALHLGRTAEAVKGADELAAALERCSRPTEVAGYAPWVVLGLVSSYRGDADRAIAAFERGRDVMRTVGLDWLSGLSDATVASTLLDAGRWDDALSTSERAELASQATGNVSFLPMALAVRALVEARRGEHDEAARTIELAEQSAPRPFNGADHLTRARSALASARGDLDDALIPFVELAARDDALGIAVWTPKILLDAVLAAYEAGDHARVGAFARRAPVDHAGTASSSGSARAAAALATGDTEQLWTAAAELAGCLPYESCRLASAAARRSTALDRSHAAAAEQALTVLDQLGATAEADRLRRSVVSAPRDRAAMSGRDAWALLTPAEQRVSRLVGEGFSNREVADSLGTSPRTVEAHLRSVFAKLDVSSRLRLAVLVHELGFVDLGESTDDTGELGS